MRDTRYRIRWEGNLRAPFGEPYTFFLLSDAETTLYLGDQQLKVTPDASGVIKEATMTMPLSARIPYPIRVEYIQRGPADAARLQLDWRSPTMAKKEIELCYLYASAPPPMRPRCP